jgi:RNA-binding protein YhbY
MPRYRCCFMGEAGEVVGVEMFEANDEGFARARAEQIVARVGYAAVEVWDHTGMIYRAERRSSRETEAPSNGATGTPKPR